MIRREQAWKARNGRAEMRKETTRTVTTTHFNGRRSIIKRGIELDPIRHDLLSETRGPPQDPMVYVKAYEKNT